MRRSVGEWRLSCALSVDGDGVCCDDQKVQAEKIDEEEPSVLVHPRESSQDEFCDPGFCNSAGDVLADPL